MPKSPLHAATFEDLEQGRLDQGVLEAVNNESLFTHYDKVALAIDYLVTHLQDPLKQPDFKSKSTINPAIIDTPKVPSLEELAKMVDLSPHHFQRVFKAGVGISPKRFLQFIMAERAREALRAGQSVLEASYRAGLSGPSRLHDLTLISEAMTPAQVRNKGAGEVIYYDFVPSPFGSALMGATQKGICWLSFLEASQTQGEINACKLDYQKENDKKEDHQKRDHQYEAGHQRGLRELSSDWPKAELRRDRDFIAPLAKRAFAFATHGANIPLEKNPVEMPPVDRKGPASLALHIKGSNFQIKVWEALLKIPHGMLITYGDLAKLIGSPKAARAVGSAVGANAISLLIPCHRVILSSGVIHNYRWGTGRKKAILAIEGARNIKC